jgi:hypothetical protein
MVGTGLASVVCLFLFVFCYVFFFSVDFMIIVMDFCAAHYLLLFLSSLTAVSYDASHMSKPMAQPTTTASQTMSQGQARSAYLADNPRGSSGKNEIGFCFGICFVFMF